MQFLFLIGLFALISCSTNPQTIVYNEDQCHACKMIISNSHFGTEMVTTKGKIYKFDAVECLVPELLEKGESNYAHILVTDYLTPHKLIDAKSSKYLISKKLPSPMGGFLSTYAT